QALARDRFKRDLISDLEDAVERGEAKGKAIGEAIGETIGEAKGEAKGRAEVARRMMELGVDMRIIAEGTGLSQEELRGLVDTRSASDSAQDSVLPG
ncbi:MAG: hypothetical protein JXM71_11125, partial [Spirochaetales bacterium]|nr:hypothetical protein [Spirochaetales bacterium]